MTRDEALKLIWDFEDAVLDCERHYNPSYDAREDARERLLKALTGRKD